MLLIKVNNVGIIIMLSTIFVYNNCMNHYYILLCICNNNILHTINV